MTRHRSAIFSARCLTTGLYLTISLTAPAADQSPKAASANVAALLASEADESSTPVDRRSALQTVLRPRTAPEAWWQAGFVKTSHDWVSFDAAAHADDARLRKYYTWRAAATESASDQLKLANRCRDAGLADQERVHLTRALLTGNAEEPQVLLNRLGYQLIGNQWFSEDELQNALRDYKSTSAALQKVQPRLEPLLARLAGTPKERAAAQVELNTLTTAETLPVLERFFAPQSEPAALALVAVLADWESFRASQTLARLALASPWESVRASAIKALNGRPVEEIIPTVLALMHMPISLDQKLKTPYSSQTNPAQSAFPELRFILTREGRDSIELASWQIFDVSSSFPVRVRSSLDDTIGRARLMQDDLRAFADAVHQAVSAADELNDQAEIMNQRAGALLAAVTGEQESSDPRRWWDYWDQITDTAWGYEKPVLPVARSIGLIGRPYYTYCACLVAGTPIWTESGFVAVDKIQAGDRVLSKNIETGELAYKPVLRTTRREGASLRKVSIGNDSFSASTGHNFWISGRGWQRVNQLEKPEPAHTVTGTALMSAEDLPEKAVVHNLVVADFHTYFVGKAMVLSRDVVPPSPTDYKVPGLSPAVAKTP